MNVEEETQSLRRHLAQLVREAKKDRLPQRYPLVFKPKEKLSPYRRLRIFVGRILRRLKLKRAFYPEPWLPGLKHVEHGEDAQPLVIWALDVDRDTLRKACRGFEKTLAEVPGFVPVLVTDVADFAFFSRLGWLVEYVPTLSAPAVDYAARKQRYLAWRYRDALALPVSAGLTEDLRIAQVLAPRAALQQGRP
jgi:hypothetical protein